MVYHKSKLRKIFALYLCVYIALESLVPTAAHALTSGPNQPEFSSFEPVATTNMVNTFSGDFTHNLPVLEIPGPHGSGYALSLSYHSGTSPEEEASWVGYGWAINPGAIIRQKRGFPDEFNGSEVHYWNKVPKNWTVSVGNFFNLEAFSLLGLNVSAALRYNNYKGWGYVAGVGASVKGLASLGYSVSDGDGSFSYSVNPAGLLSHLFNTFVNDQSGATAKAADPLDKLRSQWIAKGKSDFADLTKLGQITQAGSNFGLFSESEAVRATNVTEYIGESFNLQLAVHGNPAPVPLGLGGGISGNYTYQKNIPEDTLSAFGYMYLANAGEKDDIMDYYSEKETPYVKRDRYLAIPFSNADNFLVTGEGISGGFRLYNKKPGHLFPNPKTSELLILQLGFQGQVGFDYGIGFDVGEGAQSLEVKKWGNTEQIEQDYRFAGSEDRDEPYFFRFDDDLGGRIDMGSTKPAQASFDGEGTLGFKSFEPVIPDEIPPVMNLNSKGEEQRSSRAGYIAYHTNKEMEEKIAGIRYKAYTKDDETNQWIDRTDSKIKDGIGEIVTFNEDGNRYVYGLPVYSRNEYNFQYGFKTVEASKVQKNYLTHESIEPAPITKVGEKRDDPYATMLLLTEITSADYLDRTLDGPTPDDYGGYTKFNYTQKFGEIKKSQISDNWYEWRIPYTGLLYHRNELSDPKDDLASVIGGEKEIYYLSSIETKTHLAEFITSDREDGIQAAENADAAQSENAKGPANKRLQKLDRIELYAKKKDGNQVDQLIKTIHFEYDYSLAKGIPNSANGQGKLTLTKVWFEYEGIVPAKISPYVFNYEYMRSPDYPLEIQQRYPEVVAHGDEFTAEDQNPNYSPFDLDRWGNYQYNGKERHDRFNPWVNQNPAWVAQHPNTDINEAVRNFDPAVWQLKRIKLPSGGEIQIQYEEDEYRFLSSIHYQEADENPVVRPVPALAMVSLKGGNDSAGKYYLNVTDLRIEDSNNNPELQALRSLIQEQFIDPEPDEREKMFFKFLFALVGETASLEKCNSEYISGFVNVEDVGIDAGGLFVILGGNDAYSRPLSACYDLVRTSKGGMLDPISDDGGAKEVVMSLLARVGTVFFEEAATCLDVDYENSYLRVPLTRAKIGGGLRVKRLLMFDNGLEAGDAGLYGREYLYETSEGESSGVASNEPPTGREENALVTYLARDKQSWYNRLIAGKDRKQTEGPLGETILPAASVGYSRVIIKNIHKGKTNPGFEVNEFYTAYDKPFKVEYTGINKKTDYLMLPLVLVNRLVDNIWMTQGYSFTLNNFHGQPKSISTYSGDYEDIHNPEKTYMSSRQGYTYFGPGKGIEIMESIDVPPKGEKAPGGVTEIVFESRTVEDITKDIHVSGDITFGFYGVFVIPYIIALPYISLNRSKLSTHVTTKVTHYPAILQGVTTTQEGIIHETRHIAFNPDNGKPVLTKTYDGFHGLDLQQSPNFHVGEYRSYSFPASRQYKSMGQKAFNERKIIVSGDNDVRIDRILDAFGKYYLEFSLEAKDGDICEALGNFGVGDLVEVIGDALFHTGEQLGNRIELFPINLFNYNNQKKNKVTVEIIRSGRTNQLNQVAGSITTYGAEKAVVNHPIDPAILGPRQQLADAINEVIAQGDGVIEMPAGLGVLCEGECREIGENLTVQLIITNGQNSIEMVTVFMDNLGCFPTTPCFDTFNKSGGDGRFRVDPSTGNLIYIPEDNNPCLTRPITCFTLCPQVFPYQTLEGVVAANATAFDDNWEALYPDNAQFGNSPYQTGEKGKWRIKSNHVYNTGIIGGSRDEAGERIYKDAGVFTEFTLFNWQHAAANDPAQWLPLSTITRYSPDGNPVEEQDILGIYSAAKFGYEGAVPYLVAQNADYPSVQFVSFEKTYQPQMGDILEEDQLKLNNSTGAIDEEIAHSGKRSYHYQALAVDEENEFRLKEMPLTKQIKNEGLSIKLWLRKLTEKEGYLFQARIKQTTVAVDFEKIAQSGKWTLYEAKLRDFSGLQTGDNFSPYIYFKGGLSFWIDDVRLQPLDAQVNAYVYDPVTLRLLTSFDDQHFGLYYQYNAEGQLVRKLIETERGIKTVQEAQYHTPTVKRK